jgi:hypothetical protein
MMARRRQSEATLGVTRAVGKVPVHKIKRGTFGNITGSNDNFHVRFI